MKTALLLVVAACGDNLVSPIPVDGARLGLAYYTYEDGTRQLAVGRMRDLDRHETCVPRRWSDGFTYCTPDAVTTVFTDDTCTQEIGMGDAPTYLIGTFGVGGEQLPSRLFETGAPIAAPAKVFAKSETCDPIPPGTRFFQLGDEVPRDALVHVIPEEPTGSTQIGQRYLTSGDGLRAPLALVDLSLGLDCIGEDVPGSTSARCIPIGATAAALFHDMDCTIPESSSPIAPTTIAWTVDSCTTYYAPGEQQFGPSVYARTSQCFREAPRDFEVQFLLGDELSLATLSRTRGDGARIEPLELAGLYDPQPRAFDTQLGVECSPVDGRCLPALGAAIGEFSDPTCTMPIELAQVPAGACDPVLGYASDGTSIYPIGVASPQRYELTTGETCRPYTPPPGFALFELGAPVPPTTFATVEDPHA